MAGDMERFLNRGEIENSLRRVGRYELSPLQGVGKYMDTIDIVVGWDPLELRADSGHLHMVKLGRTIHRVV